MSTMKPDYFIAHNGLPSIVMARSRQLITRSTTKSGDRVALNEHHQPQQIHPPDQNNRLSEPNQQAHAQQCDSEKNLRNRAIKESLRHTKSTKDLINARLVKSNWCRVSSPKCASDDNSACDRNAKRHLTTTTSPSNRDNRLTYQRKYDNTIFRHDLPDRIVLPPLPI